jgi:cyclophilin family peptidyl-prolyl cis-trans isomerase
MRSDYRRFVLGCCLFVLSGCGLGGTDEHFTGSSEAALTSFHEPALVLGDRGLCGGAGRNLPSGPTPTPTPTPNPDPNPDLVAESDRLAFLCDILVGAWAEGALHRLSVDGQADASLDRVVLQHWHTASSHEARVASLLVLGQGGGLQVLAALRPDSGELVELQNGARALEAWLQVRAWGRVLAREAAKDSLVLVDEGESHLSTLIDLLSLHGPIAREAAAALVTLEAPQSWASRTEDVREALRAGVDGLGQTRAVGEPPEDVGSRIHTAVLLLAALEQQRSPADRPELLRLLSHDAPQLRSAAARILGGPTHVEAAGVRDALWDRLLHDPSDAVAALAAEGVLRGLRVPPDLLVRAEVLIEGGSPSMAFRLGPLLGAVATRRGAGPVIGWTERMIEREPEAGAVGVDAVGALPDPPLTPILMNWARHPHPAVEGVAVRALHRRWERIYGGEEEMAEYVTLFAEKIRSGGRMAATYAMRGLGHPVFLPFGGREVLEEALATRVQDAWYPDLAMERDRLLAALAAFESRPADVADQGAAEMRAVDLGAGGWLDLGEPEIPHAGPPAASFLVLELARAALVFELFLGDCCPAAALVAKWADEGRFDEVPLHRVVPGLLVQGGDGLAGDGTGGVRAGPVPPMGPAYPFARGTLGLALPEAAQGAGMQIFVTLSSAPGLDGGFSAVGQLVSDPRLLDDLRSGDRIRRGCVVSALAPVTHSDGARWAQAMSCSPD